MSDTLFEVEASHAIYVNRLASKQVNDLNHFWLSYLSAMQSALENYAPDMRKSELNRLIAEINEVITFNMSDMQEQLFIDLQEFGEYETQFQAKAISAAAGQSLALPATEQVIAAAIVNPINMGKAGAVSLKPWLANITTRQKQLIEGEIKLGYANGVPTHQIISSIVGTKSAKYEDGAIDLSRKATTSLVRTAVNHYATTARHAVYEKNKRVVIGYRWISTLDKRTSSLCRNLDQTIFYNDKKGSKPKPPAHPNCRSATVGVIKGKEDYSNGERASRGGVMVDGELKGDPKPVSSGLQYYSWLKQQPKEFVDDVLGKTKSKIFRNSDISPEDFRRLTVSRTGKPMTIKEMASKDKSIHNYIESQTKK